MDGILIYDSSCPFCAGLATRLKRAYGVDILPNDSKQLPSFVNREAVKKDVHLIRKRKNLTAIYTGVEAAVEIVSHKHPVVAKLYSLPIIKQMAQILYYIVKKIRKYL
jgi:predicted DCC family thiol-disulfide oxidoreductase YuxK